MDDIISDFGCVNNSMSSKHYSAYYTSSRGEIQMDYTDHPIRIIYNKGNDNDQMLLTRIRQACAKKGYPISNANKWLGKLKKDKVIEI